MLLLAGIRAGAVGGDGVGAGGRMTATEAEADAVTEVKETTAAGVLAGAAGVAVVDMVVVEFGMPAHIRWLGLMRQGGPRGGKTGPKAAAASVEGISRP